MTITYIQAISALSPGTICHAVGDGSVYSNIVYDGGTAIPLQTTLDAWILANPILPNLNISTFTVSSTGSLEQWNGNAYTTIGLHLIDLLDTNVSSPTSGQFLSYNGTNWINVNDPAASVVGSGVTLQSKISTVPAASGTSTVTLTNSTPTSSTGTQIWSNTITPSSTSSKIAISGSFSYTSSSDSDNKSLLVFVFRGTTCIGTAVGSVVAKKAPDSIAVHFLDSPASTATQTYSIRVASNTRGSWYINQYSSAYFNGTMALSTMKLEELA